MGQSRFFRSQSQVTDEKAQELAASLLQVHQISYPSVQCDLLIDPPSVSAPLAAFVGTSQTIAPISYRRVLRIPSGNITFSKLVRDIHCCNHSGSYADTVVRHMDLSYNSLDKHYTAIYLLRVLVVVSGTVILQAFNAIS